MTNWADYESRGSDATKQFRQAVDAVEAFFKRRGLSVPYKLTTRYTGFKQLVGNKRKRVVVSVRWGRLSTRTCKWHLRLALPQGAGEGFRGQHWEFHSYTTKHGGRALFRPLLPNSPSVDELEDLLIEAHQWILHPDVAERLT